MRYASSGENGAIFCKFTTGDTVTMSVYDSQGNSESLTSASATEIGSTGIFYWSLVNIEDATATHDDFLVIASNGTYTQQFHVGIGGFPDEIMDDSIRGTGVTQDPVYLILNGYVEPEFTKSEVRLTGYIQGDTGYLGIAFQVGQIRPVIASISLTGIVHDATYDAYAVDKVKIVSLRL